VTDRPAGALVLVGTPIGNLGDLSPRAVEELRRADVIAAAGVIHIPQGDLLFPEMTVLENLLMGAYNGPTWGERNERLGRVYELFPWLKDRARQLARTLSGGERRMLALGRGLMSKAKILLIDEPSLGLAPLATERFQGTGLSLLPIAWLAIAVCYALAGFIIGIISDRASFQWIMLICYLPAHLITGWSFGVAPYSTMAFLISFYVIRMKRRRALIFQS